MRVGIAYTTRARRCCQHSSIQPPNTLRRSIVVASTSHSVPIEWMVMFAVNDQQQQPDLAMLTDCVCSSSCVLLYRMFLNCEPIGRLLGGGMCFDNICIKRLLRYGRITWMMKAMCSDWISRRTGQVLLIVSECSSRLSDCFITTKPRECCRDRNTPCTALPSLSLRTTQLNRSEKSIAQVPSTPGSTVSCPVPSTQSMPVSTPSR